MTDYETPTDSIDDKILMRHNAKAIDILEGMRLEHKLISNPIRAEIIDRMLERARTSKRLILDDETQLRQIIDRWERVERKNAHIMEEG